MMRALLLLAAALPLAAHVGSPDVFFEGNAGPYPLFVTIRPPLVIPGTAEIEIRSSAPDLTELRLTPTPLTGDGAKFAPTPDLAQRDPADPQFFRGTLWMMASGSWQVRIAATGARGAGKLSVPVPAVAQATKQMDVPLGIILAILGLILSAGVVSIAGAAARESQLEPGATPAPPQLRRARRTMAIASAIVIAALYLGNLWWTAEARAYDRYIFKPLTATPAITDGRLRIELSDPGWLTTRKIDDFLPDHGHLMHLYVVSLPNLDRAWHLHPDMTGPGLFEHNLPAMPAGRYALYGDLVHENGFPETITSEFTLAAALPGAPLTGDDSAGPTPTAARIVFDRDPAGYRARKPASFRFRLVDEHGAPARDMELYMGMPAHAAFLRRDRSVFAHVHPGGSVPMASLALTAEAQANPHMLHHMGAIPPEVSFPYGFPKPGPYRIIVQMKHSGTVEMAMFDVEVAP
ncbi:MAG: hypothetical protein IPJ98_14430 [Bryobacterales bacterium]|nr:hypothetical protein [Bryobacterales bacterium]